MITPEFKSQEEWEEYKSKFEKALKEYEVGDIITLPHDLHTEEEFFKWLKGKTDE